MEKLRRKIVLGVFLSATVVFALTILFVGLGLDIQEARRADAMTEELVKHGGKMPKMTEPDFEEFNRQLDKRYFGEETVFRLRYFTVSDENGTLQTDLTYIASVDEEKALALAQTVRSGDSATGYQDGFRYRISSDGDLIVFLDNSDDITAIRQLVLILFIVSIFFIVMITLVFWFLSKRIVKPFEENARMQKQFITDASHELKTPLAIISANAEVLAYKDGENEWIENITSQVSRVSELVNELLILNRLEEVEEISDISLIYPIRLSVMETVVTTTGGYFAVTFRIRTDAVPKEMTPVRTARTPKSSPWVEAPDVMTKVPASASTRQRIFTGVIRSFRISAARIVTATGVSALIRDAMLEPVSRMPSWIDWIVTK